MKQWSLEGCSLDRGIKSGLRGLTQFHIRLVRQKKSSVASRFRFCFGDQDRSEMDFKIQIEISKFDMSMASIKLPIASNKLPIAW
jgi:hypothetical protein